MTDLVQTGGPVQLAGSSFDPDKLRELLKTSRLSQSVRPDVDPKIQDRHYGAVQQFIDIFNDGAGGDAAIKVIEHPERMMTTIVFDEEGRDRAVVWSQGSAAANGKIAFVTRGKLTLYDEETKMTHSEIIEFGKLLIRS